MASRPSSSGALQGSRRSALPLPAFVSLDASVAHTGSYQASFLGVYAVIFRLMLDSVPDCDSRTAVVLHDQALEACKSMSNLVTQLCVTDRTMFWMPCEY